MRQVLFFAVLLVAGAVIGARMIDAGASRQPARTAAAKADHAPKADQQPAAHGRVVTIKGDDRGHFQVEARVDGRRLDFVVDTGASVVALRESEAARLGIRPHRSDYTVRVSTANGETRAAPVKLAMIDIDGIVVRDVQAIVHPDDGLSVNLLGMSFLSRVRFSHDRGKLVIEQ